MNKLIFFSPLLCISILSSCSAIKGYRQDPSTWRGKETVEQKKKPQLLSKNNAAPKRTYYNRLPTTKPAKIPSAPQVKNVKATAQPQSPIRTETARTIPGFIEPNVTNLPDNKDLQEANAVAPAPISPRLISPMSQLLIQPSEKLPSNP